MLLSTIVAGKKASVQEDKLRHADAILADMFHWVIGFVNGVVTDGNCAPRERTVMQAVYNVISAVVGASGGPDRVGMITRLAIVTAVLTYVSASPDLYSTAIYLLPRHVPPPQRTPARPHGVGAGSGTFNDVFSLAVRSNRVNNNACYGMLEHIRNRTSVILFLLKETKIGQYTRVGRAWHKLVVDISHDFETRLRRFYMYFGTPDTPVASQSRMDDMTLNIARSLCLSESVIRGTHRDAWTAIPGIGMKTASFLSLYSRAWPMDDPKHRTVVNVSTHMAPSGSFISHFVGPAVLDTHILAWLSESGLCHGTSVPASTPGCRKKYLELETILQTLCWQLSVPMKVLDFSIWLHRSKT